MNETIGELVSGQECVIEKRYAPSRLVTTVTDEGETRSSYKTVISSDDLALYRKHCKWNELEKFPTRAGELLMYKGTAHPCYGAFYYSKNTQCIYSDTDSVDSSSIVYATINNARYKTTIEDLFLKISLKTQQNEKEYAHSSINQQIYSPCLTNNGIVDKPVLAIYRHKVKKAKWQITLQSGKKVIVTGDHSIMIVRNGEMSEIKAKDINRDTDFCISIKEKQC